MPAGSRAPFWLLPAAYLMALAAIFGLSLGLPDAALTQAGLYATDTSLAELRQKLGLDRPPVERFVGFCRDVVSGRLRSWYTSQPIVPAARDKAAVSLRVLLYSMVALAALTALWLLLFRRLGARPSVDVLLGTTASIPVFITGTFALYLCTALGIPPAVGAGTALAVFPSLILSTNIHDIWRQRRHRPYAVLEHHYRLSGWSHAKRLLHELVPSLAIVLNAFVFFLTAGLAVVESIFGLPGLGRWMLDSILRLDLPVVFLVGTIACTAIAVLFAVNAWLAARWLQPVSTSSEAA